MSNIPALAKPYPTEGVVGYLTPEQEDILKQVYKLFFDQILAAPIEPTPYKVEVEKMPAKPKGDDKRIAEWNEESERRLSQAAFKQCLYFSFILSIALDHIPARFERD